MTGDDTETAAAGRSAADGGPPTTDGPARLSNRQLFTVATAFTVIVVALGVAGAALPRYSHQLGLVVMGCIAAYVAFGLAIVYRAGRRL